MQPQRVFDREAIDKDRILAKLGFIAEQRRELASLLSQWKDEELLANQWTLRGVKYTVQTGIEAMIDIAYHLSAKGLRHPPNDARDAIAALRAAGLLDSTRAERYVEMVGFRNRLVHGYETITGDRLLAIVRRGLGDFDQFVEDVKRLLSGR
ncbi:MAG: DUF86 domain-containing protein [Clostridia bacterium]|nr:DUF86 domain-containing protein [Clostridia bacterium]